METPDEEFDVDKDWPVVTQGEYDANPSAYRELCWDVKVNICVCNVFTVQRYSFRICDEIVYSQ